jgi:hypothetical protein
MSKSTEDLIKELHLPPPPSQMTEEAELSALEEQMRKLDTESLGSRASSPTPSSRTPPGPMKESVLHQLHANLEARLMPFWSSVLPGRTVRLSLFASGRDVPPPIAPRSFSPSQPTTMAKGGQLHDDLYGPLQTVEVQTAPDGSFVYEFVISWDTLCTHQRGVQVAFSERNIEHELVVQAELLQPPPPQQLQQPEEQGYQVYRGLQRSRSTAPVQTHDATADVVMPISLSHAPIRAFIIYNQTCCISLIIPPGLISDIDDTIKRSSVLSGARAVFYNVFVRDLQESLIPEMPEWYNNLWHRGLRFHYVVSPSIWSHSDCL